MIDTPNIEIKFLKKTFKKPLTKIQYGGRTPANLRGRRKAARKGVHYENAV
jgi:hypothetical protein